MGEKMVDSCDHDPDDVEDHGHDDHHQEEEQQHADQEEAGRLPGFRFHPTDEELVSFYLRRKVERRPISIELVKQIDIYKHDPWDIAKTSCGVGDNNWYFYCKRGRKYKNSIRPNRMTGSGFWKATGIDKPIYSSNSGSQECIGLKKSLVYYRGSAGKGTKTDWVMHEFRLPTSSSIWHLANKELAADPQDAEIWTLCRISKRSRKYTPDWRQVSAKKASSNCNVGSNTNGRECHISFQDHAGNSKDYEEVMVNQQSDDQGRKEYYCMNVNDGVRWNTTTESAARTSPLTTTCSSLSQTDVDQSTHHDLLFAGCYGSSWDDLRAVVEFSARAPFS